ncbi:uncharacterized protein LOC130900289 [Diorhabda carinulata]|uniref:uncharacterized protein LOC130900289 n=1 Tax=Diorhabda carinulata TaxID=1163345 RepID=UPI0025A2B6E2|nr:uncharacterized protein LOC130900289 [Diorhabda carinulata]
MTNRRSRGKFLVNLVAKGEQPPPYDKSGERLKNIDVNSSTSFEQRPYETKGVDLKHLDLNNLKNAFSSHTKIDTLVGRRPVAHITPIKRNINENAQHVDVELLERSRRDIFNTSISSTSFVNNYDNGTGNTSNVSLRQNENTSRDNNFTMELRKRKRTSINKKDNYDSLEIPDSPNDAFEDSGSSYVISDREETVASHSTSFVSDTTDGHGTPNNTDTVLQTEFESQCYEPENENSEAESNIISPIVPVEKFVSICPGDIGGPTSKQTADYDDTELRTKHGQIQNEVTIDIASKIGGKRIRDKEHACYFCQKLISKPKLSKERRDAFSNLIRYGDFYHNCDVLATKNGNLILARRVSPAEEQFTKYYDYGPCPECLGFLYKKHIWHHLKYKCKSKSVETELREEESLCSGKGPIAESTALLNGIIGTNLTPEFLEIVHKFRNDAISNRCKEDETIMRYGAFLFEKYSSTQSELIRQSMRQLGRLSLELKKQGELFQNLNEMLIPEKFDVIVNATKVVCLSQRQDTTKRPEFGIPSLALKIGYGLKKCAAIERGQSLRKGDLRQNRKYLGFLHLLNLEWAVKISSNALSTMHTRKSTAEDLLPVTDDLVKLNKFLNSEINKIKENVCNENYSKLLSLTLARIIMFNKRRSGEAAKMTLNQYLSKPNWSNTGTQELKDSLTPLEVKLANALTIVKIIGKRGRIVPIILTEDMKESVDLIISKRIQNGILAENPFVFAIANTTASHIRGHDSLKKWCIEAELQSPDLVTSTKLRKYIATVCQVFNLTENEYDWLARHLGHDIRVHREFYRLQENAVELTKVSRLLLAVDQGEVHKYSGKQLNEISIQDLAGIEYNEALATEENESQEIAETNIVTYEEDEPNNAHLSLKGENRNKTAAQSNKSRKTYKKQSWTTEEKEIVLKEFKLLIEHGNLPGKKQCNDLIEKHKIFTDRKWTDLKFFIKNHLSKISKQIPKKH